MSENDIEKQICYLALMRIFEQHITNFCSVYSDSLAEVEIETRVILNNITTVVKAYNLHRALLVWAPSRHNLSLNSKIEFHTADNNDNWSTYMVQKSETGHVFILTSNVYERSIDNISHSAQNYFWIFYIYPDYHHYYSYEIIASYPGHNPEELSSN